MNYKKLLSAVCAIAMVCSAALTPLSTAAVTPSVSPVATMGIEEPDTQTFEGMKYFITDENEVTICGYEDDIAEKLVIPEEIDGKPVTGFSQMAFYNCAKLKEVTIPATVTSFGMQTFLSCENLEKVNLPEGLTSIYEAAFAQCTSLKSVTLPSTMTELGNLVFSGCTSLEEVNAPACLTQFGEPAFSETPWLEAQIADKGYAVLNNVLLDGSGLEGEVTIPEGITSIAPYAFFRNEKITKVTGMDAVRSIGLAAFCDCTKLAEIDLPAELDDIGSDAFANTPFIASYAEEPLMIISGVLYDGKKAEGDIIIPDTVKHISRLAFMNSKITSVTLPETVESIGVLAFNDCEDLERITFLNPNCEIPPRENTICTGWDENYNTYYKGTIEGYTPSTAKAYAEMFGYTFKSLGEAATEPTEATTEPTEATTEPTEAPTDPTEEPTTATEPTEAPTDPTEEPTTATEPTEATTEPTEDPTNDPPEDPKPTFLSGTCGEHLMWDFDSETGTLTISGTGDMDNYMENAPWANFRETIKTVIIKEGVTSIGDFAFVYCESLTSITFATTVNRIGMNAFESCIVLASVTIPDGVTCIEECTFDYCLALNSVNIPDSVTTVNSYAFNFCKNLTEITIPASVTMIGFGTFGDCEDLTICGYKDSAAQAYATKNGHKFKLLDEPSPEPAANALGDLDNDGIVNASDAAKVLIAAAAMGAGEASGLTDAQMTAADVNGDGTVNASDAAIILIYAAAVGAGDTDAKITDFVKK